MILWWLLLSGCATPERCPAGFASDAERSRRILALIGHTESASLCFGSATDSVVRADGLLMLDVRQQDPALAARVAHLLDHLDKPAPGPGPDCVKQWMQIEERGRKIEVEWTQRFGIEAPSQSSEDLRQAYSRRCEGRQLESP